MVGADDKLDKGFQLGDCLVLPFCTVLRACTDVFGNHADVLFCADEKEGDFDLMKGLTLNKKAETDFEFDGCYPLSQMFCRQFPNTSE